MQMGEESDRCIRIIASNPSRPGLGRGRLKDDDVRARLETKPCEISSSRRRLEAAPPYESRLPDAASCFCDMRIQSGPTENNIERALHRLRLQRVCSFAGPASRRQSTPLSACAVKEVERAWFGRRPGA